MKEMFDLDYLSKDLTGNSEIQSAIDRCLAFMKLEKWEKALQIINDLTDMHPESPAAWFARARLTSNDFTVYGLISADERRIVNEASDSINAAVIFADADRKDEYTRLQATFADRMRKQFVDSYVALFESTFSVYRSFTLGLSTIEKRLCVLCDTFKHAAMDSDGEYKDGTMYGVPSELIAEIGKDYPSVNFAAAHINIINDAAKGYQSAIARQERAQAVQEARFEQRRNWNQRQGFGHSIDSKEREELSKLCPVHPITHYYENTLRSDLTLAKLIKENSIFSESEVFDEKVKDVFKIYLEFCNLLNIPVGDMSSVGMPEPYYKEIMSVLNEIAEKEREQKQLKAIAEHEEEVKREEERKEAAAIRAAHNSKRIKLLFVCLFFGTLGIHNFMMGEKKKGVMKILLLWTGLATLLAIFDFLKLLFDKYDIPEA